MYWGQIGKCSEYCCCKKYSKFDILSDMKRTLDRKVIDWNAMHNDMSGAFPLVGQHLRELAGANEGEVVKSSGYSFSSPKLLNFPPRIVFSAEIEPNEKRSSTDPNQVDSLVQQVAQESSMGRLGLRVLDTRHFPMDRGPLAKDPVHGRNPEYPRSIDFQIRATIDNYENK